MRIVIDTHIILQLSLQTLSSQSRMQLLQNKSNQIYISGISLWEISKLCELNRIKLNCSLKEYLKLIEENPKFKIIHFDSNILDRVSTIASSMHKDPADQIITATALELNAVLMTDDEIIAKSKLVEII